MGINLEIALAIAFGIAFGLVVYVWSSELVKILEFWLERNFKK